MGWTEFDGGIFDDCAAVSRLFPNAALIWTTAWVKP